MILLTLSIYIYIEKTSQDTKNKNNKFKKINEQNVGMRLPKSTETRGAEYFIMW